MNGMFYIKRDIVLILSKLEGVFEVASQISMACITSPSCGGMSKKIEFVRAMPLICISYEKIDFQNEYLCCDDRGGYLNVGLGWL